MTTKNDFDETRIMQMAQHIRNELTATLEADYKTILDGCPAYKDITNQELEVAIIRALGLMVVDGTSRMFRFQRFVDEYGNPVQI